ncbi:hypothetical protein M8C21_032673 [Ambrosia artemisiifolia]|uniref:Uncharacterized protein n=1 Tax=Ambrosia artemisiifolia TaxID=4212 RepID=A0AAD5GKJ6_AMBAR|nr:hypothetical protein M8C21_032673 [Ambrosia artemisiifolia]
MCGGAVISDVDPTGKLSRKLTSNDLWNEFDTFDLFAFDIKPSSSLLRTTINQDESIHKPKQTEEAAKAYDEAATRIRGNKAKLNFPKPLTQPVQPSPAKKLCVEQPPPAWMDEYTLVVSDNNSCSELPPISPALMDYGCHENHPSEFKEQISNLETFLGLEHESSVQYFDRLMCESNDLCALDEFTVMV